MAKELNSLTPHTRIKSPRDGRKLSAEEKRATQELFLKTFSQTANVKLSCLAAKISRNAVYAWLEKDEQFSLRYHQAELDANDTIRAEMYRRGVHGVEEPVVSVGKLVYVDGKPLTVKKYSDNLLSLLAKSRMPEFREKQQVEHSGSIDITGAKELLMQRLTRLEESIDE